MDSKARFQNTRSLHLHELNKNGNVIHLVLQSTSRYINEWPGMYVKIKNKCM